MRGGVTATTPTAAQDDEPVVLVELFAGSAAVSLKALGHRYRLMSYMGSKWRYANDVLAALELPRPPDRVVLSDAGPWGSTWQALDEHYEEVVDLVRVLADHPDHVRLWDLLRQAPVPDNLAKRAATHLVLQRLAFRGKPIHISERGWVDPGLSRSSATGVPATERFGAVKPQVPALVRRLDEARWRGKMTAHHARAETVEPVPGAYVYLDPDYQGTTGYGVGSSREAVCDLARRWAEVSRAVVVSEAEPLDIGEGWSHVRLKDPKARMGRKRQEWLTCWRSPGRPRRTAS